MLVHSVQQQCEQALNIGYMLTWDAISEKSRCKKIFNGISHSLNRTQVKIFNHLNKSLSILRCAFFSIINFTFPHFSNSPLLMYFTPVNNTVLLCKILCVCVCVCIPFADSYCTINNRRLPSGQNNLYILRNPFIQLEKKKNAFTVRSRDSYATCRAVTADHKATKNTSKQLCMLKNSKRENGIQYENRSPETAK